MGISSAFSRCKATLGNVAKSIPGRPGAARPGASKQPPKTGLQAKANSRPMHPGLNGPPPRTTVYKAKRNDSSEVESFQGTLPLLGGLDSPPLLKKAAHRNVIEACREQEASVQVMWDVLTKVLGDQLVTGAALKELQAALRAAPAALPIVWPFSGSSGNVTNLVCCKYNIPDMLHAAFHLQRVQQVLPLLQELLLAATPIHPNDCPVLHETLSLLVELHAHPQLPRPAQDAIASILGCWNLQQVAMEGDFLLWTDEKPTSWWKPGMTQPDYTLPGRGIMLFGVGLLQQSRPNAFDSLPAALQLSPIATSQISSHAATASSNANIVNPNSQNGLVSQAAMAEAVQAAREEEQQKGRAALDKAHAEGQQAAARARREGRSATKRAVAIAIANCKLNQKDKIEVFHMLSEQPSDIFVIKAYYERHTNVFKFDFNERMRQRRRERLSAESMQSEEFNISDSLDATYDSNHDAS